MAVRHPLDEISMEGYPGYYKCPEYQQDVKGVAPSQRHLSSMSCARGIKHRQGKEAEEAMTEQLANLPTFYIEGAEIEHVSVDSFTYLGREIASSDDDFPACLWNLAKAKAKWGALSRVLKGEGASAQYRSRIYLIVVSTVLLYGSKTWVVTDRMKRVLEAFHHGCARHITQKYIHRVSHGEGRDEFWVYPSTAMVLKEAHLKPSMDYITERRQVFHDNFLRFSPRFAESKDWKVASHARKFLRYHNQQWMVSTEDTEHTEQ